MTFSRLVSYFGARLGRFRRRAAGGSVPLRWRRSVPFGPRGARFVHIHVLLALALVVAAAARGAGPGPVAIVLGEPIERTEIVAGADEAEQARSLLEAIWGRIAPDYLARKGLRATAEEVAELSAYDREFRARDRAQRARKLAELERWLAAGGLAPAERAHLEEFRAVLARMAARDAEADRRPPSDAGQAAARYGPWIEMWKMNRALYEQYGGVVALTPFGHDPHGARAALIAEYEREGLLAILDAALRGRVFALLAAPPSMVVPPERVDFTPYWKRPIPPSYFPD